MYHVAFRLGRSRRLAGIVPGCNAERVGVTRRPTSRCPRRPAAPPAGDRQTVGPQRKPHSGDRPMSGGDGEQLSARA